MAIAKRTRRFSAGVELHTGPDGSPTPIASARIWAPACRTVEFIVEDAGGGEEVTPLSREPDGFFSAEIPNVSAGDRYWYQLDGSRRRPDPATRFQPDGPHGPSAIVDPTQFAWSDGEWGGVRREGQVLYELHVGTFTPEGTWAAAAERLDDLADVGVTVIQMMPVAEFAGRWGWGYDGVNIYAPTRLYGAPDDLRRFVDRAHRRGLGVILDVVYNHLGPDGNYLLDFSPDYFTDRYKNDWGLALNFEGPAGARAFFVDNAAYWIVEYHFDGLRLDATQDVQDASAEHVIASIARRARAAAPSRDVLVVAENEPQHPILVRDVDAGGYGLDALLNDDYHHAALVALTGRREAYYTDYTGSPQELLSASKYGYLYQGQWYSWQDKRRGEPGLDLPGVCFVHFLENHDQIANSSLGKRVHQLSSPGRYRALTALTLLGPATPLLFQGQEFAATSPFHFFADHHEELRTAIREGRRTFLSQFPSARDPDLQDALSQPDDPRTFEQSRLRWAEREAHVEAVNMHRDLLAIRRDDPVIRAASQRRVDGAVLNQDAFALRYFGDDGDARLLVVNLGADTALTPLAEPLLAPPRGSRWEVQWSSDDVAYGGLGYSGLSDEPAWKLHAESAVLLRPARAGADSDRGQGAGGGRP